MKNVIVVVRVSIRTYIDSDDKQCWKEDTGKFFCIFFVDFTSLQI